MNPLPVPKLPAILVSILGVVAAALTLVAPSLASPWRELTAFVVAFLGFIGIVPTVRSIRAHGDARARQALRDFGTGGGDR